jgi:hypothetical protein
VRLAGRCRPGRPLGGNKVIRSGHLSPFRRENRRLLIGRLGPNSAEARGMTLGQTPVSMPLVRAAERFALG